MLVNSKERNRNSLVVYGIVFSILLLLAFKMLVPTNEGANTTLTGKENQAHAADAPSKINSALFTEDVITEGKNLIHKEGNASLYLNNELGIPTLMIVYADSISELQRNGRFLSFIYLKDPSEWRSFNKQHDHILLVKETLVPAEKIVDDTLRHIFKFKLEHPFFSMDNLQKLEFVRHTRALGRFEEVIFVPDSLHLAHSIKNTLEPLTISVTSKRFEKITKKRNEALQSGILITDDDDFVNVTISADGKEGIKSQMRLKGDWTDHLEHPTKWSYRIVPEGEETVFGMRKISVQHPKSRNYLWEWLFNKVVKDNDLIGLRYQFINTEVVLSDRDSIIPMGIMALEESFDKILIENNRRREGIILGFDESRLWDERKRVKDLDLDYPEDVDYIGAKDMPVKVYNENKTLSTANLSEQFNIAKNLIVGLRDGKLALSEAFDSDKLAMYIALSNLFGGHHGLHVENIRIYYNPVTNKLEPISFDSNSGYKLRDLREYPIGIHDDEFKEKLFEKYQLVSSEEFINSFVEDYAPELNTLALNLLGEFNEAALDLSILEHNANLIKKKIYPGMAVNASFLTFDGYHMTVQVENISDMPVVVDNLVLNNRKTINEKRLNQVIYPKDTVVLRFQLKKSFNNAFVSKKNKEGGFRFPKDLKKIQMSHHVLGAQSNKYAFIKAFDSKMDEAFIRGMELKPSYAEFDFIDLDASTKTLLIKKGVHPIDRLLYIPEGYVVKIEPGCSLNLSNKASIISYSPVIAKGTANEPVRILSDDNTGGGIFVSSSRQESILDHAYFTNLSVPQHSSWALSGAVNFNETHVEISNCRFENNRSEDALNIIRSTFVMDATQFHNTFSDSFDGDFVEGLITNTTFTNSGNDGIDVSGSKVEVRNVTVINPSDKGLSAGEGSTIVGTNVSIKDGEIGLVSKDLSRITIDSVSIIDTRLAISCFQKKSEFGPGIIDLKNAVLSGNEVAYLIEEKSDLIIDDKIIPDRTDRVIEKMYGSEYGKSSK